jgi:hypothetical protein
LRAVRWEAIILTSSGTKGRPRNGALVLGAAPGSIMMMY